MAFLCCNIDLIQVLALASSPFIYVFVCSLIFLFDPLFSPILFFLHNVGVIILLPIFV